MLYDLKVNRLFNPVGIDDEVSFSWKISSEKDSVLQTHYEIMVMCENNIIWDSGKVADENSARVPYNGRTLESGKKYNWTVKIWDNYEHIHYSEEITYFITGVYDNAIWENSYWIKKTKSENTSPLVFKYSFKCNERPTSAVLFSTALGNYDIYINGNRVGNKTSSGEIVYDELKPGFTEPKMQVHYQTYDVMYCFEKYDNCNINVLTGGGWWIGRIVGNHETHVINPNRQGKDIAFRCALMLEFSDGRTEWIKTDNKWKFSNISPIIDSDIYDGEIIDYTKVIDAVEDLETVEISNEFNGYINSSYGHNVFVRKDLIKNGRPFINNDFFSFPIVIKSNNKILIDLEQNIVGFEEITVNSKENAEIIVRHAESLNSDGTLDYRCNRDGLARSIYRIGQGVNMVLKPYLTYYGFRFLEIETTGEIEVLSVRGIVISAITAEMECGHIKTNCDEINKLVKNALWSQRGNFSTVPTDCPQRDERHAFTGDVQIYCTTANYYADVHTYLKKWLLEDVVNLQHTNGSYPSTAPQSRQIERYGMAGWSDGGIIIPYKLYLMSGDKDMLKTHYSSLVKFMNYLQMNGGPGDHYGDWATPNEKDNNKVLKAFLADAYYCIDLICFIYICDVLNKVDDKIEYMELLSERKQIILKKYCDDKGLKSSLADSEGLISQTACIYTIYYDLVEDNGLRNKIIKQLNDNLEHYNYQLRTGFLGTPILLPTLSKVNLNKEAYKLILQKEQPSWLYSVLQGATTVWEYWSGKCSQNHFAYGSVCEWLYAYLAGIKPDLKNPGFKHIIIEPQIVKNKMISQVEAEYNSPYGYIKVDWKLVENGYNINLEIPPNTTATLILPSLNLNSIDIIYKNRDDYKTVHFSSVNKLQHQLKSGRYSFCVCAVDNASVHGSNELNVFDTEDE